MQLKFYDNTFISLIEFTLFFTVFQSFPFSVDNGKIFTQSAKARQIQECQTLSGVWNNYLLGGDRDIPSSLVSSQQSFEDRMVISTNTRNIAALAAKKRTKVHKDLLNTDKQISRSMYRPLPDIKDEPVLTPSRLAKHNRTFTDSLVQAPSEDEMSLVLSEKVSEHTEVSLPPIASTEEKYRAGLKKPTKQETELKRKRRGGKVDNNYLQQVSAFYLWAGGIFWGCFLGGVLIIIFLQHNPMNS